MLSQFNKRKYRNTEAQQCIHRLPKTQEGPGAVPLEAKTVHSKLQFSVERSILRHVRIKSNSDIS